MSTYIPRTKRSHHPVQPIFRLTPQRVRILELLTEYTRLRVSDIAALRGFLNDVNIFRSTNASLQVLMREGYVDRLPFVDDTSPRPQTTKVYFLTQKGADYIEYPGAALSTSSKYILRHDIQIVQFHIALKRWAEKHNLILHWHEPLMDHKKAIIPDAYFGIEDPQKPDSKNTLHYFLEMERAKIGNYVNGEPSIIRKLTKYYDLYDSDDCEKEWGFRKFRVITVVRTSEKQINLCERLKDYAHRMFWITNEGAVKENIGGNIFTTPKDYKTAAYSFISQ